MITLAALLMLLLLVALIWLPEPIEEHISSSYPSMTPLRQHFQHLQRDSGEVMRPRQNFSTNEAKTLYDITVTFPAATWVKLEFDNATLGNNLETGPYLRLTSLRDNAVQLLDHFSVQEWYLTSAYFNGDSVRLEIVAPTDTDTIARVVLRGAWIGGESDGDVQTICDGVDKRKYCTEAKAARYLGSGGCSGWIVDDEWNCFFTAGHCGINAQGSGTIQFHVPLSSNTGVINHPPPEDQFSVDRVSVQMLNGGIGNDWGYFGVFLNSNTGLSAVEHIGNYTYHISEGAPPSDPTIAIHIAGHGTCLTQFPQGACESRQYSQVNKNHTSVGSYMLSGTTISYRTDTTGGNSGSGVEIVHNYDSSPENWRYEAIGVHTHGGCESSANYGTAIQNAAWRHARATPRGVCLTGPYVRGG